MFQLIYPYDPAPFLPLPTAEHPGGMNHAGGEMVPVVEPSGLVIGQTARSLAHGGTGLLHPVVHLHVINRNEQLFIQKRSMNKDLLPGRWDTAVGGHVDYGESLLRQPSSAKLQRNWDCGSSIPSISVPMSGNHSGKGSW